MGAQCSRCGKEIGLFNLEFKCRGCGNVFCSDCVVEAPEKRWTVYGMDPYSLFNLGAWPDFETSFTKMKTVCCMQCQSKYASMNANVDMAISRAKDVVTYSRNYKGRVQGAGTGSEIWTGWFDNRDDAMMALKIMAVSMHCDIVYDVHFDKDTWSEPTGKNGRGTHHYSVFRYGGIATRKETA